MKKTILLFVLTGILNSVSSYSQTVNYAGTFLNTTYMIGGTVTMSVNYLPADSISGYVNFTGYPGGTLACGAGFYQGYKSGDSLYSHFISHDTDAGCGSDWGYGFYLYSKLFFGTDSIAGAYSITDNELGYYNMHNIATTGITTVSTGVNVQIYPNPLATTIQIKAPAKVNVTILNLVGQVILQQQNAKDINMSGIANGIYIIKVYDDNNMILKTEKLVKAE